MTCTMMAEKIHECFFLSEYSDDFGALVRFSQQLLVVRFQSGFPQFTCTDVSDVLGPRRNECMQLYLDAYQTARKQPPASLRKQVRLLDNAFLENWLCWLDLFHLVIS